MLSRGYGFKQIEKHLADKTRQEVWMDEGSHDGKGNLVLDGNQDRWRLITTYEDIKTDESNNGRPIGDWAAKKDKYSSTCTDCNVESRSGKPLPNGMSGLNLSRSRTPEVTKSTSKTPTAWSSE